MTELFLYKIGTPAYQTGMFRTFSAAALLAVAIGAGGPAPAQRTPIVADSAPSAPVYADFATLVLKAPLVIDATIRSVARVTGPQAAGTPAGNARLYVTADVKALIRGADAIAPRISYVVDLPIDARGRPPKLSKQHVLLFARAIPGNSLEVQLAGADAQRGWTPAADALVRAIVREVLAPDAPPMVTGVGNAFYVAGALPGEGETQIFLTTADNRPVSLSILHRPGEKPHWAVALSEIVDEAAGPPTRDTLLWYRLACALPADLPRASVASLAAGDADVARTDYRMVVSALGNCERRAGT